MQRGPDRAPFALHPAAPSLACYYSATMAWNPTAVDTKYDIKEFHAAGLECGSVPLDILDAVIDRYIKAKAA